MALGGAVAALFFFEFAPRPVQADSIRGHADLIYSRSDVVSTDLTGNETRTDTRSFIQLYSLAADKYLLPNLRLFGSGTFQQTDSDSITNGERTSSRSIIERPFLDLTLRSSPISAGANYGQVTTEQRTSGAPKMILISETYSGFLGWRPAELPTLDVLLSRTKNYDKDRALVNTVSDRLSVNSAYTPVRTVHLQYYGNFGDQRDLLGGTETKTIGHDGKVDYGDQFFKGRLNFSASEEYAYSTIRNTASNRQAVFNLQVFAVKGLSLNTFDVQGLSRVPLADTAYLIDNILNTPRLNTNNIGSGLPPQDQPVPRNFGLQFAVASEVNTLDVWVYSVHDTTNPDTTQDFLSPAVAGAYTWAVYTSADNITWSLYQSAAPASYLPFAAQPGVGKFEITFPPVTTQYIKVVVVPLLPSAAANEARNFPGVYVTELQAFSSTKAAGTHPATTQTTNVQTKVSILERPYLYYDFSYFDVQQKYLTTERNSTMSNGLTLSHQLSRVFSGSAGAQRLDLHSSGPGGNMVIYQFGTTLTAVPLPTLHHTASYNSTSQETQNGRSTSQSVYLSNTAELYQGVSAYLNAGETWATDVYHQHSTAIQYSYGASVAPYRTLSITVSSVYSKTGGYYSRSDTQSVAYNPFTTLYLNASWTQISQTGRRDQLQSYGLNWSPFPGGDLVFGFAYLETLQQQNNTIQKTTQETLRWNINRTTYAQAAYSDTTNESDIQHTSTKTVTAELSVAL